MIRKPHFHFAHMNVYDCEIYSHYIALCLLQTWTFLKSMAIVELFCEESEFWFTQDYCSFFGLTIWDSYTVSLTSLWTNPRTWMFMKLALGAPTIKARNKHGSWVYVYTLTFESIFMLFAWTVEWPSHHHLPIANGKDPEGLLNNSY